jgi:hypothetical protein
MRGEKKETLGGKSHISNYVRLLQNGIKKAEITEDSLRASHVKHILRVEKSMCPNPAQQ